MRAPSDKKWSRDGCEDGPVSNRPVLRVRRSGALLVGALIAFAGTLPLATARRELLPLLLIPVVFGVWALRAGTDVHADRLRVQALIGSVTVPWSRVAELAPDEQGRVSALLDDGTVVRLTAVTRANLPQVLEAGGQTLAGGQEPAGDKEPAGGPDAQ